MGLSCSMLMESNNTDELGPVACDVIECYAAATLRRPLCIAQCIEQKMLQ
jgi:hypothetical protein